MVKFLFVALSEITLSLKVTLLFVVVNVTLVLSVVTPSYCLVEDVVILLPISEVPETENVVIPVIAPSMSAFPDMSNELFPDNADAVLIVPDVLVKVLAPLIVIPAVALKVWSPIELISC